MSSRSISSRFAVPALVLAVAACAIAPQAPTPPPGRETAVVPKPLRLDPQPGEFVLRPGAGIFVPAGGAEVRAVAEVLAGYLKELSGAVLTIAETASPAAGAGSSSAGSFRLALVPEEDALGGEGYRLDISPDAVRLSAARPAGLFYGVQTLRQLLAAGFGQKRLKTLPCAAILDRPRFPWRGMLLDCSRHFFPKDFVKRWIDILALHKMNVFHWHLTDDQGWRLEVGKYPRLTEAGAWRVDREDKHWNAREPQRPGEKATYGGFYSRADVREILAYAASRFVTVVPEIEMPGHAKGALAAYPELSCTGGPFTVPPGGYWPITDVFCPGNEATFSFLEDVLAEVCDLFPGRYVHIGGDEVDKTEWKRCPKCQARIAAEGLKDEEGLQSYFIRRIERFLNARGKSLVGWDEILQGGLAPRATVMSWRGTEGGIAAARSGHDVVMTPTSNCYLDYYQGDPELEPPAIGGFLPLRTAYAFEPVPEVLTAEEAAHILGGQGNLWTEYISEGRHAEYMAMPRAAALAEVLWSPKGGRSWEDFAGRLEKLMALYGQAGLNYARSAYDVSAKARFDPDARRLDVVLSTELPGTVIRYTTNGRDPDASARPYGAPLTFGKTTELRAAAFRNGWRPSPSIRTVRFLGHLALAAPVALTRPYSPRYDGGGPDGLTDGLFGSRNIQDGRWQGFEGDDLEAVVDLGSARTVRRMALDCLRNINSWVFPPSAVEFAVSGDGREFETVFRLTGEKSSPGSSAGVLEYEAKIPPRTARFVKVTARNVGVCPPWHFAAGSKAWLLADEIVVQ